MSEINYWTDNDMREFAAFYSLKEKDETEFNLLRHFEKFKQSKTKEHKDYEILRYVTKNGIGVEPENISWYQHPDYQLQILSVKRNDGEVFSLGEKVSYGKPCEIIRFFISSNNLMWCDLEYENENIQTNVNFGALDKVKQPIPLFTTEDGVKIFTNDRYYFVVESNLTLLHAWEARHAVADYTHDEGEYKKPPLGAVQFSTKEKAEEYILFNKPCLSVNDVVVAHEKWYRDFESSVSFKYFLKELAKSKIV